MRHRAFTLVELLAVLAIIVILIGLLLPAISGARRTAFNAMVSMEMQQVSTCAGIFNGHFGDYPKVNGGGPNGEFRLCTSYSDPSWPEVQYLRKLFPNIDLSDNGLRVVNGVSPPTSVPSSSPELLDGNQALVFWLSGGTYTNYQGMARSARRPFQRANTASEERRKFMDFPQGRMIDQNGVQDNRWRDPHKVPYAVLGVDPLTRTYPAVTCFGVAPYERDGRLFNSGSIQIICAGMDERFGPGGVLTPGVGSWKSPSPGRDDMTNFRSQTLGDDDR